LSVEGAELEDEGVVERGAGAVDDVAKHVVEVLG
jgi:hypothetical protein